MSWFCFIFNLVSIGFTYHSNQWSRVFLHCLYTIRGLSRFIRRHDCCLYRSKCLFILFGIFVDSVFSHCAKKIRAQPILSQYTLFGIWANKNKIGEGKKNILPPLNSKKFFFVCRRPLPAVYWGRLCLRSLRLYVVSVFRKPEFAQSADIMYFTLGLALRQAVAAWRVVMVVQLKTE